MMPAQEIDELEEDDRFGTSLTACAVYLVYSGLDIDELEWVDGTCTFYFENTQQLQEEFMRYASGQARVEPQQYSTVFGQVTKKMRRERDRLEGHSNWNKRH